MESVATIAELKRLSKSELARMVIERDAALVRNERELMELAVRLMVRIDELIYAAFWKEVK